MKTMICADTNGPRMCAPLARNENENETKLSNHGGQNPTSPPNRVKNIISYMNYYIYIHRPPIQRGATAAELRDNLLSWD